MKRWVLLFAAFLCFGAVASAQDFPKVEVFGGYSFYHFDSPGSAFFDTSPLRASMNGGSASISVNPFTHLGLVADFGGYASGNNSDLGATDIITYLFGPKVAFRSGRFTPFAQFLVGGAHVAINGVGESLAWSGGLGLDVNMSRHFGVRLGQLDYIRTYFADGSTGTQHNLRASAGVVFRF
jgi:Outer membrane protein beta-barrel domain